MSPQQRVLWSLLSVSISCLCFLGANQPALAQEIVTEIPELLLTPVAQLEEAPLETAPSIIRSRRIQTDNRLLERLDPEAGSLIRFTPFDDVSLTVELERSEVRGPTSYTWYGDLLDVEDGSLILVVEEEAVLVNVWAPTIGSFQVRLLPDGGQVVREINSGAFPRCAVRGATPTDLSRGQSATQRGVPIGNCADDGSVIDLLVVYTEAARIANGGTSGIEALISMAEAATNTPYLNSGITTTVNVVLTQEVVYAESGSPSLDRQRLTDPDDGFMDEVHDVRDLAGADVVTLLVNSLPGFCGIAHFSILAGNIAVPSLGFNVVRADCAVDNFTFAHELGHNQGSRHNRGADNSDNGAFLYSHGYIEPSGVFRTVMAVFTSGVDRVGHFSNPDVNFMGLPTGVPIGLPNSAHNAMSIDQTAFNVSNFRPSVSGDCNGNGVPDNQDIVDGTSSDLNDNGIPDECELGLLFVDATATGANDGSSWTDAFTDLQDAIDQAINLCTTAGEIWVAKGTYFPDRGTFDRSGTFQMASGLAIYGGFAGNEISSNQRDPKNNLTVLSGDLNSNDGPNFANYGENSFHVVNGAGTNSSAILDGFTITAGNANAGFPDNNGGGMHCEGGAPTIGNCIFDANRCQTGGGAVHFRSGGDATVIDCIFTGNDAGNQGGAVSNFVSSPAFVNCTFHDNGAEFRGGAVSNSTNSDPAVVNCSFSSNDARRFEGGAWNNLAGTPAMTSCIFWGNTDGVNSGEAAQIFVAGGSVLVNYTLVEGLTGALGGVGNIGGDPLFADSDLRILAGSPCIDAGDNLAVPLNVGTDLDDNARLFDDPLTLDTGNGTPPIVDMGAFEFGSGPPPRRYVDLDALPGGDGLSWGTAFIDLQDALDDAAAAPSEVTEIWVAEGIYVPSKETILGEPRSATFQLLRRLAVYGGFVGNELSLGERNPRANRTILSGDLNGDDGPNFENIGDNCFHVVTATSVDPTTILDGFVITGGNTEGTRFPFGIFIRSIVSGGGLYVDNAGLTVGNCIFVRNSTNAQGGAVGLVDAFAIVFTKCSFIGNQAVGGERSRGGAVDSVSSNSRFINCLFSGNLSLGGGGAVSLSKDNSITVLNCSLSGNRADRGGAFLIERSSVTVANTIAWGNSGGSGLGLLPAGSTVRITYSDIEGLVGGGVGNIDADPLFADPDGPDDVIGTEDDNLRLTSGSPCIDAADNDSIPISLTTDLDGNPRFLDDPDTVDTGNGTPPIVDIGSYEFFPVPAGVLLVDDDAPPMGGDGMTWMTAFADLQTALDVAVASGGAITQIWVAEGTYVPSTETTPGDPRSATFQLLNDVAVYGGFDGTELDFAQRAGLFNQTLLSGDINGDDGPNFANYGENVYHVVTGSNTDSTALLDGLTVTGGHVQAPCCDDDRGGGLRCVNGSPTLVNCTFVANGAASSGFGGGLFIQNGSPTLIGCVVEGNQAKQGGGMIISSGSPTFMDCIFRDNTAQSGNGGVAQISGATPSFVNCLFNGNVATAGGGGALLLVGGSNVTLVNCTLSENVASHPTVGMGGGIWISNGSATLDNCILWANSDVGGMDQSAQVHIDFGSSATADYSCIQGLIGTFGGVGNIGNNPLFVDPGTDNFRLLPGSPCIDAADNTAVPGGTVTDLDGNPRFVDDPATVDTGNGTPPIVDMGAYEFQGS